MARGVVTKRALMMSVAALVATTLGAACGSSSKSSSDSATTTTAGSRPEDLRTTAANVTAGLTKIQMITAEIATTAGTDKARAQELSDSIEGEWKPIEGTVKENDADTYITFEDQFAVLANAAKSGDAAKASAAAIKVKDAVTAYTNAYPS